ncbi:MAG: 50S ribosomal protein L23 [candidate division NC10 bacterium]|nr:50S ribosomal protein L23 [candidate division NC10 bacterium]
MKEAYQIIKRPLITERGTHLKEAHNQYFFEVARSANKVEIKKAIESLFHVHVVSVNTLSVRGKEKRVGRFSGRTSDWKKAIVTLKAGDSIEFVEGA